MEADPEASVSARLLDNNSQSTDFDLDKCKNMEMLHVLKQKIDYLTKQLALQRRCIRSIGSFERFLDQEFECSSNKTMDNVSRVDDQTKRAEKENESSNGRDLCRNSIDGGSSGKADDSRLTKIQNRYESFKKTFRHLKKRCHLIQMKKRPAEEIYNCLYELFDSIDRSFAGNYELNSSNSFPRFSTITNDDSNQMEIEEDGNVGKTYICPKEDCRQEYQTHDDYIGHIQSHFKQDLDDHSSNDEPAADQASSTSEDAVLDANEPIEQRVAEVSSAPKKATTANLGTRNIKPRECKPVTTERKRSLRPIKRTCYSNSIQQIPDFKFNYPDYRTPQYIKRQAAAKEAYSYKKYAQRKRKEKVLPVLYCNFSGCDFQTNFKTTLQLHRNSEHSGFQPFECETCRKKFKSEYSLKMHAVIHQNKRYHCPYENCDAVYSWYYTLTKHIRKHNNQIPVHRCDWPGCDYQSYRSDCVRKHRTKHTGERPIQCRWSGCDKTFKNPSGLYGHLSVHRNERKHACTWPGCSYRCNLAGNLRKHYVIHERKLAKNTSANSKDANNLNFENESNLQPNTDHNGSSLETVNVSMQIAATSSSIDQQSSNIISLHGPSSVMVPHQTMLIHEGGNIHF